MELKPVLKLIKLVQQPLVLELNPRIESCPDLIANFSVDLPMWNPDPRGGNAWCIETFCLYNSHLSVQLSNDCSIIYSSRIIESRKSLLSEGIEFTNLRRGIGFARGTAFGWGSYFAKYHRRSVIIFVENPWARINIIMRPEDSLEKILSEWQLNSSSENVELHQITPNLLCMRESGIF
tara:strand:+ start:1415 stop:1951 length:537 start_codon:yes stop_codon:yes gene_type:complete